LSPQEQNEYFKLLATLHNLESINHTLQHNLYHVIDQMIKNNLKPSSVMQTLVGELTNKVALAMEKSMIAIADKNSELALEVIALKSSVNHLTQEALKHQSSRLKANEQRLLVFRQEMQLVEGLKHIFSLAKRTAHLQLTTEAIEDIEHANDGAKLKID
jgi:phosphate:Na+ symporter